MGSIAIVGTGIKAGGHLTLEANSLLSRSDFLFYLVADPVTKQILDKANPTARSFTRAIRVGLEKASTISISCEASGEHADVGDGYPRFC